MAAAASDLPDPNLQDAERNQPISSPLASEMQIVVLGQPAVPLRQVAPGAVLRGRRTARKPRKQPLDQVFAVVPPAKKLKITLAARKAKRDFELPSGWTFIVKTRKNGDSSGHKDKYYFSPGGKQYRSLKEVKRALELL